eukprot:TRINITY_DN3604_c0_g1_i1.p3 TRINITY_DN3604_c0_g1~~TRINITY_DN3604_c0_g1_i1.p3  ORF type:complete len:114 (-),score=0.30 TRINITY_DN3604_c0_g1_i1:109-450(-)
MVPKLQQNPFCIQYFLDSSKGNNRVEFRQRIQYCVCQIKSLLTKRKITSLEMYPSFVFSLVDMNIRNMFGRYEYMKYVYVFAMVQNFHLKKDEKRKKEKFSLTYMLLVVYYFP